MQSAFASAIIEAEYFVDTDPGLGLGIAFGVSGTDSMASDISDITVPVGSLPAGTHSLGVRVKDDAGRWSNPLIRRFTVSTFTLAGGVDPSSPTAGSSFPKPAKSLTQAEYFVGTDPGQGNGTPLALTGSDGLSRDLADVTIPVGSLLAGTHNVGVRVRDEAGRWSNPLIRRFTVSTFTLAGGVDPANPNAPNLFPKPVKPLLQAEYFVGADPGAGNGIPLVVPADAAGLSRDITDVPIPLNMAPGTYDVGVRVKDESNRWSNPSKRRFTLYRQDVLAAQRSASKLVDLEFDLLDGPRAYTVGVLISSDGGLTWAVPTGSLTGDVGGNVAPGRVKRAVWHAGEDWNNGFSENMKFRVIAYETVQDTPPGFAAVTKGSFTMGSPVEEIGRGSDESQRTVAMGKPFFLKKTEVTWSEWNAVRNQGAAYGYTDIAAGRNGLNGDVSGNHPVTDVSWMDVVKWCNLRSEIETKKPVYYSASSLNPATVIRTGIPSVYVLWNASGYRLPTEAEWEYACRAGTTTAFSSGAITDATTDANLGLAGWYASNSGANTRLVGGKTGNALTLFDMHGNVREWCWDGYGAYASGPQWDPVAGNLASARVLRGGSWNLAAGFCRSATRDSSGQNSRATDIGFRLAINFNGLTDLVTPSGIPVDSRDAAAGNLIAGMRPAVNGAVYTALALPDGKILIGGDFTTVDGLTRNRLARLNADGTLDALFNPGADSTVYCASVLPDGKILIGGDFSSVASGPAEFAARLNADGTFDATFHPAVDYVVHCMAVQPDGKIVIGGDFQGVGGIIRNRVARLNPDGSLDVTFNPNASGGVRTLAVQSDGKVLIGGAFATVGGVGRSNLARVNPDGTLDTAFTAAADGEVTCLAIQSGGQIVVGGAFSSLGGQNRNGLGRLSSTGLTDNTFNPDVNGPVRSVAQQADGRWLIGGEFTTVGGIARKRLAAFTSAGALDATFALDFSSTIHSLNLLPTGKLIAAGTFSSVNGVTRQGLVWIDNDSPSETLAAMSSSRVRWLRGGSTPEASQVSFELSSDGGANWLPLGSGSRISGGWERNGANIPAQGQLRARAVIPAGRGNGSNALASSTTAFSGLVTIPEIAVETSGGTDIADGGSFTFGTLTMGANKSATFVIRNLGYGALTGLTITKDGANPTDFQITTSPLAPVTGPSGSTSLIVRFTPGDTGSRSAALHLSSNDGNESPFDIQLTGAGVVAGQLADVFDPNIGSRVNALAVQPDGKVVVGGAFTTVGGQSRGRFARLNPDLSLESTTTFAAGSGASAEVLAAAVQSDGKILLAGLFTTINAQARNRIARVMPDGSLEPTATFNVGTGPNNTVQAVAVQPDGKIILAGSFTSINSQARTRIARLNPDGTVEATTTFNAGTGAGSTVQCVALQPDGKILLGGLFTTINGQPRQRLARLQPDGSLDSTFLVDADAKVSCIAVQPDGNILIGGLFTTIGGVARNGLARLLPTGAVEEISNFDPGTGADGEVTCISVQADRGIFVSGGFTLINDEPRAGIARLYPNGTLEDSITFDTVVGPDSIVRGLAQRPDGAVIIGGDFTAYNGSTRGRLALLANQPAMDEIVVSNSNVISWNRSGTAAEIAFPTMEVSTNGGGLWTALPTPSRKVGGLESSGLSLPSSGMIRARGRTTGGSASASSGVVEIIKPFVNAPSVTTLAATSITFNSAALNATVIPNGTVNLRFEYGPTTSYGSLTSVQSLTGNGLLELSAPISGISGLYHFRVIAETTGGNYQGGDLTFVTAPEPPVAVTANPVAVTSSSATLVGAVNPKGRQTTVHFEYGSTTLYGNTTPDQVLPPSNSAVELGVPITGLNANATYHYRIVAVSSGGAASGSDVSFQATSGGTPTAAPSVTTGSVTNVATTAATLQGTVNPNGGFTNAFFEYGPTNLLGSVTPALGAGNGAVPANLSFILTGLQPGTLYHYRLVASNSIGTTQGSILTFTTNFLPPIATTGGAAPLTTISARVQGSARARNASTSVFCDFGTDGTTFPNSINATPSSISGDTETAVTADLLNLQGGVTYFYRIRSVSSGGTSLGTVLSFTPAVLSGLTQVFPPAPATATGSVTVTLTPSGIPSGWRFFGERQWRASGSTAVAMTTGDREIEFRPVPGYIQPPRENVGVISGAAAIEVARDYFETETSGSGSISVTLKPDSIATGSVPVTDRAQWRFLGDNNTQWRDSGTTVSGLPAGSHLVECKPVAGRATPATTSVLVAHGQTSAPTVTYFLTDSQTGTPPAVLPFATVSTDQTKPYAYVGQIRSNVGSSSGFVVKPRVVATAGHVVFDDGTLAAVSDLQWLFQRDAGTYEPKPQVPRGFYIFDGYAAQRTLENTPGSSSPASQNLDVAAIYFLEDAGRGGYGGFLASDLASNEFLLSQAQKTLGGYPVDGIPAIDQGRMHATPPSNVLFTAAFGRTFTTSGIRSSGGMSGGPLCIQHSNGNFYPAAVYLGGTNQTVVRAIDSSVIDLFNRAEASGNGGDNNTGGGITHSSFTSFGIASQPGSLEVIIQPAAARNAGAGWRLKPETSYRLSGNQKTGLNTGDYLLQLNTVSGFQAPTQQTVVVNGGQLRQITFTYETANTAPTISNIPNQSVSAGGSTGAIAFTVGDFQSLPSSLTITRASSNPTLVPVANIVLGGSGANRTVTVSPVAGLLGTATVTLTVSDGELTDNGIFQITVTGTLLETWRFANFGTTTNTGTSADDADPDGDGQTNIKEYAAGTQPNVATDVFRILTANKGPSTFTVTSTGKTGRSYSLERSPILNTGTWTVVDFVGPLASDGPLLLTDSSPLPNKGFYRITVTLP